MTSKPSAMSWTNWGRNQSVSPRRVEKVASARDVQITLEAGGAPVEIDAETGLAAVPAGLELHRLNRLLWTSGLSMQNLGDIEAQTVAGAISTGTHGTGARKQGLAAQVRALEMVLGDGDIVTC